LLNVDGYYDKLNAFLDFMVADGFLSLATKDKMLVDGTPAGLLNQMQSFFQVNTIR
jgi:predicted Rossmann-fold nucleotide-binding protein